MLGGRKMRIRARGRRVKELCKDEEVGMVSDRRERG